jgi:hypothetical protein
VWAYVDCPIGRAREGLERSVSRKGSAGIQSVSEADGYVFGFVILGTPRRFIPERNVLGRCVASAALIVKGRSVEVSELSDHVVSLQYNNGK